MKLPLLVLGLTLASAIAPSSSFAATVSRVTSSSGASSVLIDGVTPGSSVVVGTATNYSRSIRAGNCGELVIRPTTTAPLPGSFQINGSTISAPSSGSSTVTCNSVGAWVDGASAAIVPTAPYMNSNGAIVIPSAVTGAAANASVTVEYIGQKKTATVKANACGTARITSSATRDLSSFSVLGQDYTLSALTENTTPPICKKVGSSYVRYEAVQ